MNFLHAKAIWADFPELAAGVVVAGGITPEVSVDQRLAEYHAIAAARLAENPIAELPEIQAWRRTFAKMGHKPTQYRCAAESLLRRFGKDGTLPRIHPLIDLCNAMSMAFALPVAVFDLNAVSGGLEVRHATGEEIYQDFSGELSHPTANEVIFADDAGRAHARRWCHRQSGDSAVRESTRQVLIVAEGMHPSAGQDVPKLIAAIERELGAIWPAAPKSATLSESMSRFDFDR